MPLPQKVIDRLSREPAGTPGWSSQLLLFAGGLFAIAILVYGGIAFGYRPYFEGQRKKLNDKIQAFIQQIPLAKQEEITSFYSQLSNIKTLLDKHVMVTPVLQWLEGHTQKNVMYQQLTTDPSAGRISFSASAKSIGDVEEQLAVFEKAPDVRGVDFGSIGIGEKGAWTFQGTVVLNPKVLGGSQLRGDL